jgi:hypothetical protein
LLGDEVTHECVGVIPRKAGLPHPLHDLLSGRAGVQEVGSVATDRVVRAPDRNPRRISSKSARLAFLLTDRAIMISCRGRLLDLHAARNQDGGLVVISD